MLGRAGISEDFPAVTHMLALETVNIHDGADDIHALMIRHDWTKLSASRQHFDIAGTVDADIA